MHWRPSSHHFPSLQPQGIFKQPCRRKRPSWGASLASKDPLDLLKLRSSRCISVLRRRCISVLRRGEHQAQGYVDASDPNLGLIPLDTARGELQDWKINITGTVYPTGEGTPGIQSEYPAYAKACLAGCRSFRGKGGGRSLGRSFATQLTLVGIL
jgi:hypothetical protein